MLSTAIRAPRAPSPMVAIAAPDPALGVGRALRSAYKAGANTLPVDMQRLLDRLD